MSDKRGTVLPRTTGTLASTTVALAGLTTIGAAFDVSGFSRLFVQIDNAGANAFDAFEIQGSPDGGTTYEALYSAAGDYTTPAGALVDASGDLTALASGATGWFILDTRGIDYLRIQASAAVGSSAGVTGLWSAN